MTLGIYGGNGYLGSRILRHIDAIPIERMSLSRQAFVLDASFPNSLDKQSFDSYHGLLKRRLEHFESIGSKYLYLGSYSSLPKKTSRYGENKRLAEEMVLSHGGIVVRLGLVIDFETPGGRFLDLCQKSSHFPLLILPNDRYFIVNITPLKNLLDVLPSFEKCHAGKSYCLSFTYKLSLSELIKQIHPNKRQVMLGAGISRLLQRIVHWIPSDTLDPLKSIAGYQLPLSDLVIEDD